MARWGELPLVTSVNAPLPPSRAPPCCSTAPMIGGRPQRAGVAASTAAARRSPSRCRTRGSGRWTLDYPRGPDARELLAPDAALAGRRRPGRRGRARDPIASTRRAGHHRSHGRRPAVRGAERRHGGRAGAAAGWRHVDVPLQWTGERDGQYRGTFVSTEAGRVRSGCRRDAGRRSARQQPPTSAPARAKPSLRPDDACAAAAEDRGGNRRPLLHRRRRAGWPRTCAMPGGASPRSRSASSGTCQSSSSR